MTRDIQHGKKTNNYRLVFRSGGLVTFMELKTFGKYRQ